MLKRILTLLAAVLFPALLDAAAIDPSFRFSTVETEHFFVHFHEGLKEIADRTAVYAEEAHCVMSKDLGWSPSGKTHIVIVDDTDFANGLASVLPYNFIYIYPVPPMADTSIGQFEDWLRSLVFHEYAHIVTLDAVRGYAKGMRGVFGRAYPGADALSATLFLAAAPPNIFLPTWWIEGIATWAETQYAASGRGKSSYYEMIFRTAVAEDNLPDVDKINGDIPYWPRGSTPYIYGLAFMRHIAIKYGGETPGALSLLHSGRFPYFINDPPEALTGKDYESLYLEMVDDLKREQREKISLLESRPLSRPRMLEIRGEMLMNPRFSPDGRILAVNRRDPHGHEEIVMLVDEEEKFAIWRLPSDQNITWSPDSDKLCFSQAELQRGYNLYQDVYCYDFLSPGLKQITKGLRLKDPDISPDGKTFALIEVETSRQGLALLGIDGQGLKSLASFKDSRLSGPRWSPDGKSIVFSVRESAGGTAIYLYGVGDGSLEKLIESGSDNKSPTWSRDGRYIIFVSDTTGVYNLFGYSLAEGKTYRITHLLGGAFQPDVSADGKRIVFSSYHSRGFNLAEIDYDPDTWSEDLERLITPYWHDAESPILRQCASAPPPPAVGAYKYSAIKSLRPRFWLPTLQVFEEDTVIGVLTGSRDVLGYHTYILNPGYGVKTEEGYFDAVYVYDRFYPTLELRGYKRPDNESGLISAVSFPLRRLESGLSLTVGAHLKEVEAVSENSLFTSLNFTNALRYPYSISLEEGLRASVVFRDYSERWGGDVNNREYVVSLEEYAGLGGHHVLLIRFKGGLSEKGAFELGGFAVEDFPLRGYPKRVMAGRYAATLGFEYRLPLRYIFKGRGTRPWFYDRAHMAAFIEGGSAWHEDFDASEVKVGVGTEVRLDMVLGYKLKVSPTVGFAQGISEGGDTRIYAAIYILGI